MSMPFDPFGTKARAAYFEDRAREERTAHRAARGAAKQAAAQEARRLATRAAKQAAKANGESYRPAVAVAGHPSCRCAGYTEPQRAAIRSSVWADVQRQPLPACRMSAGEQSRWVSAQMRTRELWQATIRVVLHGFTIAASLARWSKDAGPAPSAAELQARVQAYAAKGLA
jgi:hypothetical protein